ncbi:PEP-CTERM sorting domain-containing protein [Sulfuriroseicoccus oceanibius]|uniref:PEP-CTERM sorting domain-containing protein n=1 Tax=Sulfuriroseicoccus oceanibius TaxID=2707525 RepID=A0A6B3LAV3_9BACT|nr:PEP-CTERM sorting domain-containing protein [Sulfuriroseicoccus oceanibius]QQL45587.1 PEP-CTERM sorting domain-containing protein [Sulfuriroseicoccus oceanibius]
MATLLVGAAMIGSSSAALHIQELFDGMAADTNIGGQGDSSTTVGLTGTWAATGSTGINTANNFNVDGGTLPGLASNAGAQGGVWNGTGSWDTGIYATRGMTSSIDFNSDGVIYFSVRLRNHGDTAMGMGFASGAGGSSEFVGAGFSWNNFTGGSGNAAYISHGTLDGGQGVYGQQAAEAAGGVNGYGLLVGRITLSSTGNDLIDIMRYAENDTIDNNLSSISWTAQSAFDSSMSASHLLLWMNGSGGGELDAIRVGSDWVDVTGVNAVPEPSSTALLGLGGLALILRRRK